MAEKEKDLINLAKDSKTTKKTTAKRKPTAKKKPNTTRKSRSNKSSTVKKKELTPEQERDLKAKAKVEKLLENSSISVLTKKDGVIELDESDDTKNEPKGVDWLEEQITLLSEKNQELTNKMEEVKIDFEKVLKENQELKSGAVSGDGEVKKAVISLFNELQENHIKLGVDKNGIGNFRIYCPGFLNRMIKFFPFLSEVKRYN